MAQTIYKYPLKLDSEPHPVLMPKDAKILSVQSQENKLCLWALVNPDAEKESVWFRVYATGELLPPNPGTYIATAQLGWTVWHVFRV